MEKSYTGWRMRRYRGTLAFGKVYFCATWHAAFLVHALVDVSTLKGPKKHEWSLEYGAGDESGTQVFCVWSVPSAFFKHVGSLVQMGCPR